MEEQTNKNEQALRYNQDKVMLELIHPMFIEELGKVLTMGAKKYAKHNWMKGLPFSSTMGSLLRHAYQFLKGEDLDQESGCSHLAHIACNAMFLLYYSKYRTEFDDRIKSDIPRP